MLKRGFVFLICYYINKLHNFVFRINGDELEVISPTMIMLRFKNLRMIESEEDVDATESISRAILLQCQMV